MGKSISEQVTSIIDKARLAAAVFSQFDQKKTDHIVKKVYEVGFKNRVKLAKMAHEETKMGVWQHKVMKNTIATQLVYEDIKNQKTVGLIYDNEISGIRKIAQPLGIILAIIPVTNPTSTVMFKILLALKTRNPIVISSHHSASKCCRKAAELCYKAAVKAGAPDDCIQWIKKPSREMTQTLMKNPELALILATGGPSLVKAAYSSGTPAIGVGSGNVPVLIDVSADIPFAVSQIMDSKTFDNGTICSSEQSVVTEKKIFKKVLEEFKKKNSYILSSAESVKLQKVAFDHQRRCMAPAVVGQEATRIAEMAGIKVPTNTKLLISIQDRVGEDVPLSREILAPILTFYQVDNFQKAINRCIDLNFNGGMGHTASIFSNNNSRIMEFSNIMNAGRIVVNMPSSQGAVGGIYNTLHPSLTLGCGTGGKNITTDNITAKHLINVQRVSWRRLNQRWAGMNKENYLDDSKSVKDLEHEFHRNF